MKCLVYDLETSIRSEYHGALAKDPVNDFYTVIYGPKPDAVVVEHADAGFHRQPPAGFLTQLREADILIGHNLPFDLAYINSNDVYRDALKRGLKCWDTQIAEYLMSGQRHAFASLAELQVIYLNKKIKKDRISKLYAKGIGAEIIIAAKHRCKRLWTLYEQYSVDDGVTTLQVFKAQLARATSLGMLDIIDAYNRYMMCLVDASSNGIYVDIKNTEETLREFKLKSYELMQQAADMIKQFWTDPRLPAYNVQSPAHKSALLFGGKIPVKVRKPDGQYKNGKDKFKIFEELVEIKGFNLSSVYTNETKIDGRFATGAGVIEKIAKDPNVNPIAKEYCAVQSEAMLYQKMCSTYLEPFLVRSVNQKLHPNFNGCATITSRLSSSSPNLQNCVSSDTEVLTPRGWVLFPDLRRGDSVAQVCPESGYIDFVQPIEIIKRGFDGKLVEVATDWGTFLYTDEHRVLTYHRRSKKLVEEQACDWVGRTGVVDRLVRRAGRKGGGRILSAQERWGLELAIICQAEGYLVENNTRCYYDISFTSDRKKRQFIEFYRLRYANTPKRIRKQVPAEARGEWLDETKHKNFTARILDLCFEDLVFFIATLHKWDGDFTRKCTYAQKRTRTKSLDIVQAAAVLCGQSTSYYRHVTADLDVINFHRSELRSQSRTEVRKVNYIGDVYCVSVPTGAFLVRRDGGVVMTGNCPTRQPHMLEKIQGQLIAPPGFKCVAIDYSQLEIFVQAMLTKDAGLTNDLLSGIDFHILRLSYAEDMTYDEVYKKCKIDKTPGWDIKRSHAKTISYQKAYGAGVKSLSASTGLSVDVIQKIFDKEDISYPNVKLFNDAVAEQVKRTETMSLARNIPKAMKTVGINGKKFVHGIELLPIYSNDNVSYDNEILRNVGYYTSITKKRYAFEELGRFDRMGRIQRYYSPTELKNYAIQGTAGDIMCLATCTMFHYLLENCQEIKLVNQIHDSMWFYIKDNDHLDLHIAVISDIMCNMKAAFKQRLHVEIPFDYKVDVEVGTNFANTESYNKHTHSNPPSVSI